MKYSANIDLIRPRMLRACWNAIERLPDKLLFKSRWLSRISLTTDQNIRISILHRELSSNSLLSSEKKLAVSL